MERVGPFPSGFMIRCHSCDGASVRLFVYQRFSQILMLVMKR